LALPFDVLDTVDSACVVGGVRMVHHAFDRRGHAGEHFTAVQADHLRLAQSQQCLGAEVDGRDPSAAVGHECDDVRAPQEEKRESRIEAG